VKHNADDNKKNDDANGCQRIQVSLEPRVVSGRLSGEVSVPVSYYDRLTPINRRPLIRKRPDVGQGVPAAPRDSRGWVVVP
jgi:hypothetical protein